MATTSEMAGAKPCDAPEGATAAEAIPYSLFTKGERRCIVVLVALAGWFSTLSSFIYYPAISMVADDLHTPISLVNLTVTSYMALSGIAPAVVGNASDILGRRPLYAITLVLYIAANVGIGLQNSFISLLLLRMLQSAGISGTFSIAYGVVADIAAPSERGAFVAAISFGITTAPSIGPVIGGVLAARAGWRWIFWFLTIASSSCIIAMALALPETNRSLVGNGGIEPPSFSRPFLPGIMRPWKKHRGPSTTRTTANPRTLNPMRSLSVLLRKDVIVTIIPGSILYMVYCCIHTSLSTEFVEAYHYNQVFAGLIYLPFGTGAILSTVVSGRWVDYDYRVVARAHGLPVNKVSGDDLLHFPIEEARLRSIFIPTISALLAIIAYGWFVQRRFHAAAPLSCLFLAGFSIQTCFNLNNTLVVDINQDMPATAQASFNLVRCSLAAVFVAILQDMIDAIGFGWAFTILGSLCLVAAMFYYIEFRYGNSWRRMRNNLGPEGTQPVPIRPGILEDTYRLGSGSHG